MIPLLIILAASLAAECLLTLRACWPLRRVLAIISLVSLSFASAGLLVIEMHFWSLAIAVIGIYRAINLARVLHGSMHEMFARHAVRRTALWLGVAQSVASAGLLAHPVFGLAWTDVLLPLACMQAGVAVITVLTLERQLRTTATAMDTEPQPKTTPNSTLPSLTVAIAARNEDSQLEACLTALLASDYPKLEIIVLDDCSHDRTPDIIRSFAHAGVRFVSGQEPDDGWLARNLAYDRLYHEASGSLIMFCGVDVRVGRSTLRQLVVTLQRRNKSMLSLLPLNATSRRLPLVQAMRYFWEMAPPRRMFNRPPVLSSCWLIERDVLRQAGGFDAVRRSVTPEAHFAKAAIRDDGYAFIRSDAALALTSEKLPSAQMDTAIQTRYPQLHRRPEMVLLVAVTEACLLVAPVYVVLHGLAVDAMAAVLIAMMALCLQFYGFGRLQRAIFPRTAAWSKPAFLPAVALDIYLLHLSMYRFEFSDVFWRGRNICYPVMRRSGLL